MTRKTGLQPGPRVSRDHFSNNTAPKSVLNTRLVVRIIDGASLLASDLDTGKSDPVCFAWCGPSDELPSVDDMTREDYKRVLSTSVRPGTTDPIWNEELVFPIDAATTSLSDLLAFQCFVYVADLDEDAPPDLSRVAVSYDPLGQLLVPFSDVIDKGRIVNGNSLSLAAARYTLLRTPKLSRVDGHLRLAVSLVFGEDASALFPQIMPGMEINSLKDFLSSLVKQRGGALSLPKALASSRSQPGGVLTASSKTSVSRIAPLANFNSRPKTAPYLQTPILRLRDPRPARPVVESAPDSDSLDDWQGAASADDGSLLDSTGPSPTYDETPPPDEEQDYPLAAPPSYDEPPLLPARRVDASLAPNPSLTRASSQRATEAALSDVRAQRLLLQRGLSDIAKLTQRGIAAISKRLEGIEKSLLAEGRHTGSSAGAGKTRPTKIPLKRGTSLQEAIARARARAAEEGGAEDDIVVHAKERYRAPGGDESLPALDDEEDRRRTFMRSSPSRQLAHSSSVEIRERPIAVEEAVLSRTTPGRLQSLHSLSLYPAIDPRSTRNMQGMPTQRDSPLDDDSSNLSWDRVTSSVARRDWFEAFSYVLDRGRGDDLHRLLTLVGPRPEVLSAHTLTRLYEAISSMLVRGVHVEQCVIWCLALSRKNLNLELTPDARARLINGLVAVSSKASKRGLLAALLAAKLSRQSI